MSIAQIPAEVFPPGEYLRDELAERGWSEIEFAEILGRPVQVLSEILNAKKEITPETAVALAEALGTSPELWLNLQAAYRLYEVKSTRPSQAAVARRARLRSIVPVRELQKRGWLPQAESIEELEEAVCRFLAIGDVGEQPQLIAAARRTNADASFSPEQTAWIARVQQLGGEGSRKAFDLQGLESLARELASRIHNPHDLSAIRGWLEDCGGVSLVIELPLKGSKIDGVVLYPEAGNPIVGLSTRGDRMDGFVFTLLHELAHLVLGHITPGKLQLDEAITEATEELEASANELAGSWIFPHGIVVRTPRPTMPDIIQMAGNLNVHPSFVIGRLQRDGILDWSDFRRSIPKVRPFVDMG